VIDPVGGGQLVPTIATTGMPELGRLVNRDMLVAHIEKKLQTSTRGGFMSLMPPRLFSSLIISRRNIVAFLLAALFNGAEAVSSSRLASLFVDWRNVLKNW